MTTTMTASPPLLRTTIGKKVAMAGSGLILMLWLWAHMLGNLKLWFGNGAYNNYANWLRNGMDPPFPHEVLLSVIRLVALSALVVHVYFAVVLGARSYQAREVRYVHGDHVQANVASLTMKWGGLAIFLFGVFHLLMFTWGVVTPGYHYAFGHPAQMVIGAFGVWWVDVVYAAALLALGLHLYHATWSMFQTWGVNSRRWDHTIRTAATINAVVLFVGFYSLPLGVITGGIR